MIKPIFQKGILRFMLMNVRRRYSSFKYCTFKHLSFQELLYQVEEEFGFDHSMGGPTMSFRADVLLLINK